MSTNLSAADRSNLSAAQQAQIQEHKAEWQRASEAGDTAKMQAAHAAAEAIRAGAGYSGGADGSGYVSLSSGGSGYAGVPAGAGQSAEDVQKWVDDYYYTNYSDKRGWVNGYSVGMNQRSMANYIRQQMHANEQAWAQADEAGKAYLHDQNQQLAQILTREVGGVRSTFNEKLGRWETGNANLGYGYNIGAYNDPDWYTNYYGMTEEQAEKYRSDTNRYYNFVDQALIRNWVDESSGYTGRYAQFVNGPYGQLLMGTKGVNMRTYTDVIGDGFGKEGDAVLTPTRDAEGNIVPQPPLLKNNNSLNDYTRGKSSYVDENGVIQAGKLLRINPGGGSSSGLNGYYASKVGADTAPAANNSNVAEAPAANYSGAAPANVTAGGLKLMAGTQGPSGGAADGTSEGNYTGTSLDRYLGMSHGGNANNQSPSSMKGILDQWQQSAMEQAATSRDYAVDKAVQALLLAQEKANATYQDQRDQIALQERQGLDNAALYAELRGDRGGIGQSQYSFIQAQADANRQSVSNAQVQLATDTARQIAQLRADGEFEKADEMMQISQTYLLKLLEMEQWAAEHQLSVDQFQESIRQWEQEYRLSLAQFMI